MAETKKNAKKIPFPAEKASIGIMENGQWTMNFMKISFTPALKGA
ncbi:MAG: hypothetical protein AB9842_10510 [Bacteroidales bacterium]